MEIFIETRALGLAVMAAATFLGSSWLMSIAVQKAFSMTETETMVTTAEIQGSPELVAQGAQFFAMSCSHCHADDATGDEGPSLHNLTISNARMASTIKHGVKGEMPSFAKKYDDKQITALVSYLRSLR
jgi:mono/diheme cytochrome c family protein